MCLKIACGVCLNRGRRVHFSRGNCDRRFSHEPMAAKYLRRQTWWVRFYHPRTGALMRASVETQDSARAELLRQRVEWEAALLEPRFQAANLPTCVQDLVRDPEAEAASVSPPTDSVLPPSGALVWIADPTANQTRQPRHRGRTHSCHPRLLDTHNSDPNPSAGKRPPTKSWPQSHISLQKPSKLTPDFYITHQ
jgi:hypothetical protein